MKKLTKKQIVNLVVDCICVILCILLLYTAISLLVNKREGGGSYIAWFGRLNLGIVTTSMDTPEGTESPYEISFKKGDLIKVKVLNDKGIAKLEKDDIITYWGTVNGATAMITHRIVDVPYVDPVTNEITKVETKGDNPADVSSKVVDVADIIGIVVDVDEDGGAFNIWTTSKWGRFVLLVVPALIILIYVLVMFILTLTGQNKQKRSQDIDAMRAQMEEELRAKLVAEMAAREQAQETEQEPKEKE